MRLVTGGAQTEDVEYTILGLAVLFVGMIAMAVVFNKCWGAAADQSGTGEVAASEDEEALGKLLA